MSYSYKNLTELPPLHDSLTCLVCNNNHLTKLPEHLPNTLTYLDCFNNLLTRLPIQLPNTLKYLYCYYNRLTKLPEQLPNSLTDLYCSNNRLTMLPRQLPNSLTILDYWNNTFLFNFKNNLRIRNKNTTSFGNYKMLSVIQRKIQLKMQRKCRQNKPTYFNRDLTRLCNMY